MKLKDGEGSGLEAGVDSKHRVLTLSVTEPIDRNINRIEGTVWTAKQSTTAVGAGDYVFYLKNTGKEIIGITDIRAKCGVASVLYVAHVSGTPTFTAGADIVPVNRKLGSSKQISATVKEDTNTTGLTVEGDLFSIPCPVADTEYHLLTTSNIFVTQGQAIAIRTTAATDVECFISLVELDEQI